MRTEIEKINNVDTKIEKICRGDCGTLKPVSEFYRGSHVCIKCKNKKSHIDDWDNRLRAAMTSQKNRSPFGLTPEDDLSVDKILEKLDEQNYECAGCGYKFQNATDCEIGHIITPKHGGHLTKNNVQMVCDHCNHDRKDVFYSKSNIQGATYYFKTFLNTGETVTNHVKKNDFKP